MDKPSILLVLKDYDFLAPIASGDVVARGIDLILERDTPLGTDRVANDPAISAGELSLSRSIRRFADGDRTFVLIPFFPYRGFRQRCFFVRQGSALRQLSNLSGKRIGTNDWPATGNTWSRAALREQGVRIDLIEWIVCPSNEADATRPQGTLPPYVQRAASGQWLPDLLTRGEVDAIVCHVPPPGFLKPDSPIVRLCSDFRTVERDYYRRTGLYPIHHVLGIRREVFATHPWIARELFRVLEESRRRWQASRAEWAEATPWYQAEIEEVAALMGPDWHQNGLEANHHVVQTLCAEMYAQGLIAEPIDGQALFAEFQELTD